MHEKLAYGKLAGSRLPDKFVALDRHSPQTVSLGELKANMLSFPNERGPEARFADCGMHFGGS